MTFENAFSYVTIMVNVYLYFSLVSFPFVSILQFGVPSDFKDTRKVFYSPKFFFTDLHILSIMKNSLKK